MTRNQDRDEDTLARAQEKAFDAMEAVNRRVRVRLAREALAISPLCSDGHFVLAGEASTVEEAIAGYRRAVEVARDVLGETCFEQDAGDFWGIIETRPYMRARHALALTLWRAGQREEAVEHYRDMLRLNPDDNQGIRYLLMDALIALGRDQEAARLAERYKGDVMAAWVWSEALLAFRREGDSAEARRTLSRAIRANVHVAGYLLGRKRLPRRLPDLISIGGQDEAIAYAEGALETWNATEGATAWLAAATPKSPTAGRRERRPEDDIDLDPQRIDDVVLGLLLLGRHNGNRVWKSFDASTLDRLHAKGLISSPAGTAKSVLLTEAGAREAARILRLLFARKPGPEWPVGNRQAASGQPSAPPHAGPAGSIPPTHRSRRPRARSRTR